MQRKVGSQIGKEPTTPKESGHEASRFLTYYKLRLLRLVLLAAGKDTLVFCKHADSSPRKRFFFLLLPAQFRQLVYLYIGGAGRAKQCCERTK